MALTKINEKNILKEEYSHELGETAIFYKEKQETTQFFIDESFYRNFKDIIDNDLSCSSYEYAFRWDPIEDNKTEEKKVRVKSIYIHYVSSKDGKRKSFIFS